ncbi:MAG: hypothetical protein Q9195_002537 [Heterodermia aff. obscurata]
MIDLSALMSPSKELEAPDVAKAPSQSEPVRSPPLNRWLYESQNHVPGMASDIRKASPSKYGVAPSRSESWRDKPNQLLDQIPAADFLPDLSDSSSPIKEYQEAAALLDISSSRVAEILRCLRIDEPTDGEAPGPAGKSQNSMTAGGNEYTKKAKGKRSNSKGRESSDGQDDPHKQVSAPKRVKVAAPPTRAGGRSFACLYYKRDPNNCLNMRCHGRSTEHVETIIRLRKHVNKGHLGAETYQTIRDMKKNYNMSIPEQEGQLWITAYMKIFNVCMEDVPSPFLTADVDDRNTLPNNRRTQQPTYADELHNQYDAMYHRHVEGREVIRRRYEAVEAERIEQVKSETRSEYTIATQQHEENCRLERERLKDSFNTSLFADGSSTSARNPEGALDLQEPRDTIDDTRIDGSVLQDQPYAFHQTSDVNFSESDFVNDEIATRKETALFSGLVEDSVPALGQGPRSKIALEFWDLVSLFIRDVCGADDGAWALHQASPHIPFELALVAPTPKIALMEQEPHAFGAQLRQGNNQVVTRLDILLRGLEKVERGATGAEERGDDEVEFAVGETLGMGKKQHLI